MHQEDQEESTCATINPKGCTSTTVKLLGGSKTATKAKFMEKKKKK